MFEPPIHYTHPALYASSLIQQIQRNAIGMMSLCEGWCSEQKGMFLVSLVFAIKPQTIVEIGVYGGKSLIPMAYTLQVNQMGGLIYGIDPWDSMESVKGLQQIEHLSFWENLDHQIILQRLKENIRNFSLEQQIILLQTTSENAPPIYGIDLLHIDGNHSEAMSYLDVIKWVPFVKRGGYIILDDMTWCDNGTFTTRRSCEWLDANCKKFIEFTDTCKWGVWVKP